MHTDLAKEAHKNLSSFKKYCNDEEFKNLEDGIKQFDTDLNGSGFDAIQAKTKLNWIKEMDLKTFTGVMFAYFGKKPSQYINV